MRKTHIVLFAVSKGHFHLQADFGMLTEFEKVCFVSLLPRRPKIQAFVCSGILELSNSCHNDKLRLLPLPP